MTTPTPTPSARSLEKAREVLPAAVCELGPSPDHAGNCFNWNGPIFCANCEEVRDVAVALDEVRREGENAVLPHVGYWCGDGHPKIYFHADLAENCPLCRARREALEEAARVVDDAAARIGVLSPEGKYLGREAARIRALG